MECVELCVCTVWDCMCVGIGERTEYTVCVCVHLYNCVHCVTMCVHMYNYNVWTTVGVCVRKREIERERVVVCVQCTYSTVCVYVNNVWTVCVCLQYVSFWCV